MKNLPKTLTILLSTLALTIDFISLFEVNNLRPCIISEMINYSSGYSIMEVENIEKFSAPEAYLGVFLSIIYDGLFCENG